MLTMEAKYSIVSSWLRNSFDHKIIVWYFKSQYELHPWLLLSVGPCSWCSCLPLLVCNTIQRSSKVRFDDLGHQDFKHPLPVWSDKSSFYFHEQSLDMLSQTENDRTISQHDGTLVPYSRYYSWKSKWTYTRWWIGRGGSNSWSPWLFLMTFMSGTTYQSTITFNDVTPCSLIEVNLHFEWIYGLHFQGQRATQASAQEEAGFVCYLPHTCLAYSSTVKTEAVCFSETLVNFCQITWHYIVEDSTLHSPCCWY
jgi:hypothetical protein